MQNKMFSFTGGGGGVGEGGYYNFPVAHCLLWYKGGLNCLILWDPVVFHPG